jgi:hypothetical protein
VKRSLVVIGLFALMLDLPQDSSLGQTKFVFPLAPVKSLVASSFDHFDADHLNSLAQPPPTMGSAISPLHPTDYTSQAAPHPRTFIHFSYLTNFDCASSFCAAGRS